jgi:hypothetical protein
MATSKETKPANAGTAVITSFRYYKGLCLITLANGVSGIIGDSISMPLSTMLTLKGQSIQYTHKGKHGDYDRYELGFAL